MNYKDLQFTYKILHEQYERGDGILTYDERDFFLTLWSEYLAMINEIFVDREYMIDDMTVRIIRITSYNGNLVGVYYNNEEAKSGFVDLEYL